MQAAKKIGAGILKSRQMVGPAGKLIQSKVGAVQITQNSETQTEELNLERMAESLLVMAN